MRQARLAALAALAAFLAAGPLEAAIDVVINYDYDASGFFGAAYPERRALMEQAAGTVSRFLDDLDPIVPGGSNTWSARFFYEIDGSYTEVQNPVVSADTILVYVRGQDFGAGGHLGHAGPGGYYSWGSAAWNETVAYRGEAGAKLAQPTDIGRWGGSITFNSNANLPWHFGATTAGLGWNEFDFLSTAIHELVHVLGFGVPGSGLSWDTFALTGKFTGPKAQAEGSPNNPDLQLYGDLAHWKEGTLSTVAGAQAEASLDPTLTNGDRKRLTRLDFAALDDLGWDLAMAGDTDCDGDVDAVDLASLGLGWNPAGETAVWAGGDTDGDGDVDAVDLASLGLAWNPAGYAGGSPLAAPEPGTLALLAAGLVGLARARRRP